MAFVGETVVLFRGVNRCFYRFAMALCWVQAVHQELMTVRRKCHEQNVSERRLFEKMLQTDKDSLAAATERKAAITSVITVRLHVMQRTVLLSQFCPSVCLSIRCVYCDKTKQRTANILIPHETAITLVF